MTTKDHKQAASNAQAKKPKAFVTDGCTAVPDWIFKHCCVAHDWDYSEFSRISRAKADQRLYRCMRQTLQQKHNKHTAPWWLQLMPPVYYLGVRLFGRRHYEGQTHE